jgi:glycosyltransferase involved in cell wall biosynthesis
MAQALAGLGHEVTIVTAGPIPDGVGSIRVLTAPISRWTWRQRAAGMDAHLRAEIPGADLVIVNSLYLWHSWYAPYLCRQHRVPYIIRPHGTFDPVIRARRPYAKWLADHLFQRRAIMGASAIQFTAEGEQCKANLDPDFPPGIILPLGVDPEALTTPPMVQPARDLRLVYLGRADKRKGLNLLIEAMAAQDDTLPKPHLDLGGMARGDDPDLEARIIELGLSDRVHFRGWLSGGDKWRHLDAGGLFVLPSFGENFGLAIVEAMARGLPVLISDAVDIAPAIKAAQAGYIVPANIDGVAAGLRQALLNRDAWSETGARGRHLVECQFSWDAIAPVMAQRYSQIIAAYRSRIAGAARAI